MDIPKLSDFTDLSEARRVRRIYELAKASKLFLVSVSPTEHVVKWFDDYQLLCLPVANYELGLHMKAEKMVLLHYRGKLKQYNYFFGSKHYAMLFKLTYG